MPIGQFYHVSADTRVPFRVAGAMQDLGTAQGPSNSLGRGGIVAGDWYDVGGGEAGHVVSKPDEPDIVYAGEYLGYISRYDHRTRQARNVSAYPENGSGHGAEDLKYRFQWTAPIATSPHDPQVVYHGGNVLFRTTDGGQTWSPISPDLTRNDKSKQKWSGGPITGDNTGIEFYCTIFTVAESPKQKGVIWAGSDDGLVHVTRDGGGSWTNVTGGMKGLPEWGTISLIEPSPFDAGTAYVIVDAHRLDDLRPYLFVTSDYGSTWKRLDTGLPQDIYLHAVREDPQKRGQLYVGTERGVIYSSDAGATWRSLQLNLPTVPVHDLVVKDQSLVLATHGRSLWILDDLVPLRELSQQVVQQDLFAFPTPDATRWRYAATARQRGAGQNPPGGAAIYYFLKSKPKGELTIEILDAQQRLVRRLSSVPLPKDDDPEAEDDEEARLKKALPTDPGVERAVWDLTREGAKKMARARIDAGDPERGPMVPPGTYTARISADGRTVTTPLRVVRDPRVTVSDADLEAQEAFVIQVRDDITTLAVAGRAAARGAAADHGAAQPARGARKRARAPCQRRPDRCALRRARTAAAQSDRRSDLRHPRAAGRRDAVLTVGAADVLRRRGRRCPHARDEGDVRGLPRGADTPRERRAVACRQGCRRAERRSDEGGDWIRGDTLKRRGAVPGSGF